jgi:hypothetical protein
MMVGKVAPPPNPRVREPPATPRPLSQARQAQSFSSRYHVFFKQAPQYEEKKKALHARLRDLPLMFNVLSFF